ncbi:extracellular solute-binding protein [Candidatus Parcubacteria bacterium]|nr:extracellular solute-binding protein [Candidatus Parcubacteria bacterium]
MPPLSRGLIITFAVIIVVALAAVLMLTCVIPGVKYCSDKNRSVTLTVWGVFDDEDAFAATLSAYQRTHPNTRITYRKKDARDPKRYEQDLLEAFAAGRGPDIFFIHHTWLARYRDKLQAAPTDVLSFKQFQDSFVDVAIEDLTTEGKIYAVPLYVDTLALYYNKDFLNSANIAQPPVTWNDFLAGIPKVRQLGPGGLVARAAATIGTARNINRSTDVLALLMLQSGTQIVDRKSRRVVMDETRPLPDGTPHQPGMDAVRFYTDFANPLDAGAFTWGLASNFHWSVDAFAEESAAMTFHYAYELPVFRQKNPNLRLGIAKMPQVQNRERDVNYANYWAPAVSFQSQSGRAAWEFLTFASSREGVVSYLQASRRPTARRDLVDELKGDADLGLFHEQALTAKSFYQYDNFRVEQILAEAIEAVVRREKTPAEAIETATNEMSVATR